MGAQVRTATLTNYGQVASSLGLDPDRMLRSVGIDPKALSDPERTLPVAKVLRLLEASARQSGVSNFGLLLAETRALESIGAVGLLLKHQPTVGAAIQSVADYHGLVADALVFRLDDDSGQAVISIDVASAQSAVQGMELTLGVLCRTFAAVGAGAWAPSSVHFVHAPPDDLRVHQRVFRCPLSFNDSFYGLTCSAASLHVPNPDGDPLMATHARRYLDLLMGQRGSGSLSEQTGRALHSLMPEGRATLDQVAHRLQMSSRSLQRALEQERTSFQAVLNQVRSDRALRFLSDLDRTVTDVALLTGNASLSSFTRWFTQEFGMSPAAWRARRS